MSQEAIEELIKRIESLPPERRSKKNIQEIYQMAKQSLVRRKKIADDSVQLLCLKRKDRRLSNIMFDPNIGVNHGIIDPVKFQKEVEEKIAVRAEEIGMSRQLRRKAIAQSRKKFKKDAKKPLLEKVKDSQDKKELLTLCTAISERCNILFNGNAKEFLVDLAIKVHITPELRKDETTDFVFMELQATFPELSEKVAVELKASPCPVDVSDQQKWVLAIKGKVLLQ